MNRDVDALLQEQAALLDQIRSLRELYRLLKKSPHPNRDCWLSHIERRGARLRREFDLNLNRLYMGVYNDVHRVG